MKKMKMIKLNLALPYKSKPLFINEQFIVSAEATQDHYGGLYTVIKVQEGDEIKEYPVQETPEEICELMK